MRVAMVCDEFPPDIGGASTYAAELSAALARLGAEPVVITHAHPDRVVRGAEGVEVKQIKGFVLPALGRAFSLRLARQLHLHIKHGKFDVIHGLDTYSSMALLSVYSACKRKIPSVLTCHSVIKPKGGWQIPYQLLVLTMRRAGRIIAVSSAARDFCCFLGIPAGKVEVIPNGVDMTTFNEAVDGSSMRARLGVKEEPLIVAAIRLVKRKGPGHLIAAFSKVLKDIPNAKLAIAGWGPEAANLKIKIDELGIAGSVHMLGAIQREEVAELMAAADVFVLPSLVESFGMVLLEAMAVGTPVVCTRTQGAADIIEGGVNGVTVPPADDDALAEAIVRVSNNRELAKRLRTNGLKTVKEKFSWERTAKLTLASYERVCRKHA